MSLGDYRPKEKIEEKLVCYDEDIFRSDAWLCSCHMMIKVVSAVILGCVAVALADSYVTESYATEGYATPSYHKNDGYGYDASYVYDRKPYGYGRKYDTYGRRDYGYGRKDYGYGYDRRDYGYGYDRKDYGYGYNSKDSYAHEDKYAPKSYDAPSSYDAPKETYGYKDDKYSYCDTYGSGSYMYNMCRKCASYSEKFTCEKAYYPAQSYTVKTKVGYGKHASYKEETKYYAPAQIFHFKSTDPKCFYQCDANGKAVARPCPYGTIFDEKLGVCVAGH